LKVSSLYRGSWRGLEPRSKLTAPSGKRGQIHESPGETIKPDLLLTAVERVWK